MVEALKRLIMLLKMNKWEESLEAYLQTLRRLKQCRKLSFKDCFLHSGDIKRIKKNACQSPSLFLGRVCQHIRGDRRGATPSSTGKLTWQIFTTPFLENFTE